MTCPSYIIHNQILMNSMALLLLNYVPTIKSNLVFKTVPEEVLYFLILVHLAILQKQCQYMQELKKKQAKMCT